MSNANTEELLLNRVKFIGDGEWTLVGTPDDLIQELDHYTQQRCLEAERQLCENAILAGKPRLDPLQTAAATCGYIVKRLAQLTNKEARPQQPNQLKEE